MMSRFPLKFATPITLLAAAGCMYPPMYQQGSYGQSPYGQQMPNGQQMYVPQGNFAPSGTMIVPPSNAPLYQPGGSTFGTPGTPLQTDDFNKPSNSSDPRYFGPDGQVPLPSDAGSGSGTQPFKNDLDLSK